MQVDHIDENTIRVRIDKNELARRGLKVLDLLGDKNRIQHFFYSILDEVDTDHSFTQDSPVTFQVMPNNGGLDLLITKVVDSKNDDLSQLLDSEMARNQQQNNLRRTFFDLEDDDDHDKGAELSENELPTSPKSTKSFWKFQKSQAYSFDDLGVLIELVDCLKVSDLASSLYFDQGKYYLSLSFVNDNYAEMKPADAWTIANEYGIKVAKAEMANVERTGKCLLTNNALGHLQYYFHDNK